MQAESRSPTLHEQNLTYLRSWATATEREIQTILATIAPLESRLKRSRQRLDLITRLADLVEDDVVAANQKTTTINLAGQTVGAQAEKEEPSSG